jgi:hypothetical protein
LRRIFQQYGDGVGRLGQVAGVAVPPGSSQLPGNKLFYRDQDKYLTAEQMTRRILDRAPFPKLME